MSGSDVTTWIHLSRMADRQRVLHPHPPHPLPPHISLLNYSTSRPPYSSPAPIQSYRGKQPSKVSTREKPGTKVPHGLTTSGHPKVAKTIPGSALPGAIPPPTHRVIVYKVGRRRLGTETLVRPADLLIRAGAMIRERLGPRWAEQCPGG